MPPQMIWSRETRKSSSKYSFPGAVSHAMIFLPYFVAQVPPVRVRSYPPPQNCISFLSAAVVEPDKLSCTGRTTFRSGCTGERYRSNRPPNLSLPLHTPPRPRRADRRRQGRKTRREIVSCPRCSRRAYSGLCQAYPSPKMYVLMNLFAYCGCIMLRMTCRSTPSTFV